MIYISKPQIDNREINAVVEVLKSGKLAQGKKVALLENEFSKICHVKYAVATNSGTSALHTALESLRIGHGDEVITTPFTFVATANSILMTGAKPIFADIEEDTFNIDPSEVEKKITKKTKAIVVVDLYGQPADYARIKKIARKYGLYIVEDSAQSIGAKYFGKNTGSLADIACFSLYATKNIISGEGGVITTNNKSLNDFARVFRNQGQDEKERYRYLGLGFNYRMSDLAAAIAIAQLKKLSKLTKRRQEIAEMYNKELKLKGLILPLVRKGSVSAYHQYTLRVTEEFSTTRDGLRSYLEKKRIQANIYYPIPLYKFDHLKQNVDDFPIAERSSKEVISIPVHPGLLDKDVEYIIKTIKSI